MVEDRRARSALYRPAALSSVSSFTDIRRRLVAVAAGVFIAASFGLPALTHGATYPGTLPGQFNVDAQGGGTYFIPIEAPAATGGLQPQLGLSYHHLAGNGLAGVGWRLAGISSITRCPKTYAQDGVVEGHFYVSSDRYCLDGQRLISVWGTYGAHGAEYRTEIDTLQRIVQNGVDGSTGGAVVLRAAW